jgi:peptidoglycan hydrolase-like protein with peptidoglycan-binding domain
MVRYYHFMMMVSVVLFCTLAYFGLSATSAFAATAQYAPTTVASQPAKLGNSGNRNVCPSTISKGARGQAVRTLQTDLSQLGFKGTNGRPLPVTGTFDDRTLSAVKQFQRQHHIQSNGVVGASTWQALGACGNNRR